MYNFLFAFLYSLLLKMEFGAGYTTDHRRAQTSMILISFFELSNLMSLFPSFLRGAVIIVPLFGLVIINYFCFVFGDRYKRVLKQKSSRENIFRPIAIIYLVGSIVFFAITHYSDPSSSGFRN
jgi:hypothetical protein